MTMLLIDLPLCFGATRVARNLLHHSPRWPRGGRVGAAKRLPALIALGVGLAPHLTRAVFDGLIHDGR